MVQTGPLTKEKLRRITKGKARMTRNEERQYKRIYGVENESKTIAGSISPTKREYRERDVWKGRKLCVARRETL